jgi:hypothetical protein
MDFMQILKLWIRVLGQKKLREMWNYGSVRSTILGGKWEIMELKLILSYLYVFSICWCIDNNLKWI